MKTILRVYDFIKDEKEEDVSVGLIMRRYKIKYSKAVEIMNYWLEKKGISDKTVMSFNRHRKG